MFNNVIIGIDGEDGGRDALELGKLLLAEGGRLTLANVHPGDMYGWWGGSTAYQAVDRSQSEAILKSARETAGIEAEVKSVAEPSVGRGLHIAAEEAAADLLVIGSSRSTTLVGRVRVGDDTSAALNGAPCAVAVAPAGYAREHRAMREIGVGYNGSSESQNALRIARELASQYGAKLSAFEAVSVPAYVVHGTAAVDGTPTKELVDEARERIAALGDVEAHAAYGDPAEELALYSASLDLLVLGSRDYGPLGRLVHGSTSRQLAHTARCPLLVLTRAARKADRTETGHNGSEAVTTTAA